MSSKVEQKMSVEVESLVPIHACEELEDTRVKEVQCLEEKDYSERLS